MAMDFVKHQYEHDTRRTLNLEWTFDDKAEYTDIVYSISTNVKKYCSDEKVHTIVLRVVNNLYTTARYELLPWYNGPVEDDDLHIFLSYDFKIKKNKEVDITVTRYHDNSYSIELRFTIIK